jgi:hypothetical protein
MYIKNKFRKVIYHDYQVVLQHHLLNQLLLVVEQQLTEHNMLDSTKQLRQEVDFVVVENLVVELLIVIEAVVAVVLLGSKRKE